MNIASTLHDSRINAYNVLIELSANDYIPIAKQIIDNNELQRRKVKSSGSVYSLLKQDLKNGCIIPPISLAYKENSINNKEEITSEYIISVLADADNLLILDGLQRTYLLLDLSAEDATILSDQILRIEIYIGINEISILYRMLTLNTGQTPMSLRHQIEMLYSKYLDKEYGSIKLIRQIDEQSLQKNNEFVFSDVIEGFNSYIERSESPIDRFSLLETIQNLENVSRENLKVDLFKEFVDSYYHFITKLDSISDSWVYPDDIDAIPVEYRLEALPFGKKVFKIFNRSQVLTGFGSAVGKLIDQSVITEISDINPIIDRMSVNDISISYLTLLKNLDIIRKESKKIGTSQRVFFHHFFRGLFSDVTSKKNNLDAAIEYAFKQYKLQMM